MDESTAVRSSVKSPSSHVCGVVVSVVAAVEWPVVPGVVDGVVGAEVVGDVRVVTENTQ
jgi:hypothetical protein